MNNPLPVPPQGEVERLRAELAEAQSELETMSASLRFQIGDAIVSAASGAGSPGARLGAAYSALLRARTLFRIGRIRSNLFSGLPGDGLPPAPPQAPGRELRALDRYVAGLARSPARPYSGPPPTSDWAAAAAALAREFADAVESGFPLPVRVGSIGTRPSGKRRIVYVTRHDPAFSSNGYARRTREITRGLADAGNEVLALVTGPPGTNREHHDGNVVYRHARVEEKAAGLRDHVDRLAGAIARTAIEHRADIIHSASNYLNGLAAISAARRLGIPCAYEVRGLWEETRRTIDPRFSRSLGYRLQSRMEACCAAAADALIVGSQGIAEELRRRGLDRQQVHVAEAGAPILPEVDAATAGRWRALFPAGSLVLGFVGSITAYEGFDAMAAALARLAAGDDRYRLLVVGDGPFAASARSMMAQHGVAGRVHFAGRKNFEEATAAYAAVDIAVYPRSSTPVTEIVESLKPVEALAAGVPVVVTRIAPLEPLISACPAVASCSPSSPPDLANAVRRFGDLTPGERTALGDRGRDWVFENRRWAHAVEAIEQAYRGIDG